MPGSPSRARPQCPISSHHAPRLEDPWPPSGVQGQGASDASFYKCRDPRALLAAPRQLSALPRD